MERDGSLGLSFGILAVTACNPHAAQQSTTGTHPTSSRKEGLRFPQNTRNTCIMVVPRLFCLFSSENAKRAKKTSYNPLTIWGKQSMVEAHPIQPVYPICRGARLFCMEMYGHTAVPQHSERPQVLLSYLSATIFWLLQGQISQTPEFVSLLPRLIFSPY